MTPFDSNFQIEKPDDNSKMNNHNRSSNTFSGPSLYLQQAGVTGQTYRLIIQVDKVRARPGPKSKKRELMTITTNNYKRSTNCNKLLKTNLDEDLKKNEVVMYVDSQSTVNSQEENLTTSQDDTIIKKNIQCSTCQQYFDSVRSLYLHRKIHSVCQYCDTQFISEDLCNNHEKLHSNANTLLPLKCHLCPKTFDNKQNLRVHYKASHIDAISIIDNIPTSEISNSKPIEECVISNTVELEKINGNVNDSELDSTLKNEDNSEYSCKICCKKFNTSSEANTHKQVHVDATVAEHKCNICKKVYTNEKMLNDHLAHHLSIAHHCVYCRKAFINRTTLNNHLKTHKNIQ